MLTANYFNLDKHNINKQDYYNYLKITLFYFSLPASESGQPRSLRLTDGATAQSSERGISNRSKWFRKADTNVVSVNFGTLLSPGHMHAGDPVFCSSCQAILSCISQIDGEDENKVKRRLLANFNLS